TATRVLRQRDSAVWEALIFIAALGGSILMSSRMDTVSNWRVVEPETDHFTWAGWWFAAVSRPLFQFFLYRWVFRVILWFVFLRRLSKFNLDLVASHPDRAGGLGFVTISQSSFAVILFAFGIAVSGQFATQLLFDTAPENRQAALFSLRIPIAAAAVILLLFFSGPLLLFSRQLKKCRFDGLIKYGGFAMDYVREFDKKWTGQYKPESPLGSADIQSLADLDASHTVVHEMKTVLIGKKMVISLLAAFLVPMAPLLLTVIPFEEILKAGLKLVF